MSRKGQKAAAASSKKRADEEREDTLQAIVRPGLCVISIQSVRHH